MKKIILLIVFLLLSFLKVTSTEPFWEHVNTPEIGVANAIDNDSLGNLYIFAQNGLWISTNQGDYWKQIYSVESVRWDEPVYAINSDGMIAVAINANIILSSNLGDSWVSINPAWNHLDGNINAMQWLHKNLYVLSFNDDSVSIYYTNFIDTNWHQCGKAVAAYNAKVFDILNESCLGILTYQFSDNFEEDILCLTSNGGETWDNIHFSSGYINSMKYYAKDSVFIGTSEGLKIIKNHKIIESYSPFTIPVFSFLFLNPKEYYLGTDDFIYFTLDSGKTWNHSYKGLENLVTIYYYSKSIDGIRRAPNGYLFLLSGKGTIFRSTNGGDSWNSSSNAFFSSRIDGLAFDKNKNVYLAAYDLYKSSDYGNSWSAIGGLKGDIITSVFINREGHIIVGAMFSDGSYKSKDEGKTWEKLKVRPLNNIIENKRGYLFSPPEYRSFDGGDNWEVMPQNGIPAIGNYISLNYKDDLFSLFDSEIFRSIDNGDNWDTVFYKDYIQTYSQQPIIFYPDKPIGIAHISGYEISNVKTTDNGNTWFEADASNYVRYPNGRGFKWDFPLAIDSLDNMYWLGYWEFRDSIHQKYLDGPTIIRTDSMGKFIDTVASGLPYPYLDKVIVDHDGYVWGYQDYRGLYRSKQKYVSVKDNYIPSENLILQSSPNPFSESTTIKYSLPSPSHVKLSIYDIFGREVAVVFEGWQEAGENIYHLPFNIYHLSDGIYFCRLQAGGESKVIKIVKIE
jgi:photosystem II stability/assembly factor-like uncharacterized protein